MIFVLFKNQEMIGYVKSESDAIQRLKQIADNIVKSEKNENRIFTEHIERGINIYSQYIGKYMNGFVYLIHTLKYEKLEEDIIYTS